MMTLDEAICHAEKIAEDNEKTAKEWGDRLTCTFIKLKEDECRKCADEHRQLAEWEKWESKY